ncbi:DedA family protein [Actinoalloteichus hymeniacidonis]|uniref:VTT domain-containing protein n=1 Tax=Actinoalloteichus hymeniacidonis TaxID=340345 RepID=A0AAC9HMB6_9PSEU|nr:DedA family protein [Actinoalloteichus hymeniacidonis]AOS61853.1 hypothetical protein TL08_05125 [Actinoalloteichus hymeniacidonis]MBB5910127.1 membrane protein DedA with SNARE-associated domain [Actinoalloteichus hymeniacidonis]
MNLTALAAEATSESPGGLAGWAIGLMEALGGPGAGLAIAAENIFPPLPSEVILPLAGFTASQGDMSLVGALIWTTIGSLVGAIVLYYIGAMLGRERTIAIAKRLPLVKIQDIEKTEAWFLKHGVKAVFFGRMIPIFRSFISIPAGVEKMSMPTFILFTTLGSAIWNTIFVVAGYQLGENWHVVDEYAGVFSRAVVIIVLLALVTFVTLRILKNRRLKAQGIDPAAEENDPERTQIITADDSTQQIQRYRDN